MAFKADTYVVLTTVKGEAAPRQSEFSQKAHAMKFAKQQLRAPIDVEHVEVKAVAWRHLALLAPDRR